MTGITVLDIAYNFNTVVAHPTHDTSIESPKNMSRAADESRDELLALSRAMVDNPEKINELTDQQVLDLRKHMEALGDVASIDGTKRYANLSVINWRESYLRKVLVTGFVGYLFANAKEFEPTIEIEEEHKKYRAAIEAAADHLGVVPESTRKKLMEARDSAIKQLTRSAQGVVRRFLNQNFTYNPDRHVRTARSALGSDPDVVLAARVRESREAIAAKAPRVEARIRDDPAAAFKLMRENLLATMAALRETNEQLRIATNACKDVAAAKTLDEAKSRAEDTATILQRCSMRTQALSTGLAPVVDPLSAADSLAAWQPDVPHDLFHVFDRYLTNNYENIRAVAAELYAEKPDIEFGVYFYEAFDTPEQAQEYNRKHESDFKLDVITVENGHVTLLGPFRSNRDRVDYYSKNTEILRQMVAQKELDETLGRDLMKKRVVEQKKKNLREHGVEPAGLDAYRKAIATVSQLGAKKAMTREEQEEYLQARTVKEDFEVPDNAIQVNTFRTEVDEDGNPIMVRGKFYTQEEIPLHLVDPNATEYQPVRVVDGVAKPAK